MSEIKPVIEIPDEVVLAIDPERIEALLSEKGWLLMVGARSNASMWRHHSLNAGYDVMIPNDSTYVDYIMLVRLALTDIARAEQMRISEVLAAVGWIDPAVTAAEERAQRAERGAG